MSEGYSSELERYRRHVADFATGADSDRVEHHFECLRDWSLFHTLDEVKRWFVEQRSSTSMTVDEIPLRETTGWVIDPDTGNVRHESGEFFTVHGVRVTETASREVGEKGWDQPILTQVGFDGGLLGILRQRFDGIPHYLIEAKAEPGNYGIVQLSPTLQATFSNLRRAHGGRRPRFAEVFEHPDAIGARVIYSRWLSEDGGRLYNKRNRGMLVEAVDHVDEPPEGFIWMSMYQIKACLQEDAWVNPHIRGIIAHL
jgi:oxidase EvaA